MYNVTIQCPFADHEETHLSVPADQINFEENTFYYNRFYPKCEILLVQKVNQAKIEEMESYFNKYGTENE